MADKNTIGRPFWRDDRLHFEGVNQRIIDEAERAYQAWHAKVGGDKDRGIPCHKALEGIHDDIKGHTNWALGYNAKGEHTAVPKEFWDAQANAIGGIGFKGEGNLVRVLKQAYATHAGPETEALVQAWKARAEYERSIIPQQIKILQNATELPGMSREEFLGGGGHGGMRPLLIGSLEEHLAGIPGAIAHMDTYLKEMPALRATGTGALETHLDTYLAARSKQSRTLHPDTPERYRSPGRRPAREGAPGRGTPHDESLPRETPRETPPRGRDDGGHRPPREDPPRRGGDGGGGNRPPGDTPPRHGGDGGGGGRPPVDPPRRGGDGGGGNRPPGDTPPRHGGDGGGNRPPGDTPPRHGGDGGRRPRPPRAPREPRGGYGGGGGGYNFSGYSGSYGGGESTPLAASAEKVVETLEQKAAHVPEGGKWALAGVAAALGLGFGGYILNQRNQKNSQDEHKGEPMKAGSVQLGAEQKPDQQQWANNHDTRSPDSSPSLTK